MKKGRFSKKDIKFIEANAEVLSFNEIASQLDRDPSSIEAWIETRVGFTPKQKKEAAVANELKTRTYYKELKNQFNEDELEMFEYHFKKMWSQFKDDVFHTEEMQIIDTIKLELLMNRILKSQQDNQNLILHYERELQVEKAVDGDQRDMDVIMNLERSIAVTRASQETLSKDYKDLQSRKATMLKDLKGTREQRIKQIEDSKQTFASLIKEMVTNPRKSNQMGIDMEKMRLAAEAEKERLAAYHKYEDNVVDQPFLTPETLIQENEENE